MRTLPTTLIALTVLAAGCVGTDPEPAPAAPAAVDETTARALASTDAADPTMPEETPAEQPVEVVAPVAYDVQTGTWATVCDELLPGFCIGEGVVQAEGTTTRLPFDGTITAAQLTLTWSAASPATENLRFTLVWGTNCGGDCIEAIGSERVEGASPLVIELTEFADGDAEILYAHVGMATPRPPVSAWASVDQAATVEGTLTSLVAPLH